MKKEIFKVGDEVYDATFGWGTITSINKSTLLPITVKFKRDKIFYTMDGRTYPSAIRPTLSFTEYGFDDRFSQERPIDYKDYIGKWGKFWNDNPKYFTIGILEGYEQGGHKPFQSVSLDFQNFQPLTDEQIKVLGLM